MARAARIQVILPELGYYATWVSGGDGFAGSPLLAERAAGYAALGTVVNCAGTNAVAGVDTLLGAYAALYAATSGRGIFECFYGQQPWNPFVPLDGKDSHV